MSTTKTKILHCCRKHRCQNPDIRLRGIAIQVVNNARFLGVTFDSKLRWGVQVKENKQRGHNALNIMKTLGHTKWGSNQDVMLKIHNTLVLSRIEYGSELYGAASESILKTLDPVHYSGIREALGAFCTSPRESLLAEAAVPDLSIRRNTRVLRVGGRALQSGRTPMEEVAMSLRNGKNTFGNRFQALMEKMDISSSQLGPVVEVKQPAPWLNDVIRINTTLAQMKKSETSTDKYKQEALSLLQKYSLIIYTDGSKMEEKVGYSVVFGENATKRRLDEDCSIFTAEARAILDACVLAINTTPDSVAIATDSLSTLQGVANFENRARIVTKIRILLIEHRNIELIWIPGHSGLLGNEKADKEARSAANSETINDTTLEYQDFRKSISAYELVCRNRRWNAVEENKMKEHKYSVANGRGYLTGRRAEDVLISRVRIGHSRLTHGYLMVPAGERVEPVCQQCGRGLTMRHVLVECDGYEAHRRNLNMGRDLRSILAESVENTRKVLIFFKITGLFDKV
jgi:ribonuclease HI